MSKELTLLPCPVCGGKADIIDAFERDEKGHVAIGWSAYCTRGCLTTSEHGSREKAAASWNALPRALEWTDEPPKVPGWYWYRHKPSRTIAMINVDVEPIEYESLPGQWAGPIHEPKEQGRHDE